MKFEALLFDFDGVLIESEYAGNEQLAAYLSANGHPTTPQEAVLNFTGMAGIDFLAAVEKYIARPLPEDFHTVREAENIRAMQEGIDEVIGAIAFVRGLPADLPKAIVSSSSTAWIRRHLEHIGLTEAFGDHIYSGREHVANGKPAPDLYLYGARQLGVAIEKCAILEDSPVGATGAVASGAYVIGLCAGTHCYPGHDERLKALGVDALAYDFDEVVALVA